jgi:hypothetical protein
LLQFLSCDVCNKATADVYWRENHREIFCQVCYKKRFIKSDLSLTEAKLVDLLLDELHSGKTIDESLATVTAVSGMRKLTCKNAYLSRWQYVVNQEAVTKVDEI